MPIVMLPNDLPHLAHNRGRSGGAASRKMCGAWFPPLYQRHQADDGYSPNCQAHHDQAHADAGVINKLVPFCAHVRSPFSKLLSAHLFDGCGTYSLTTLLTFFYAGLHPEVPLKFGKLFRRDDKWREVWVTIGQRLWSRHGFAGEGDFNCS